MKKIIFTELKWPSVIKPKFSNLGSIIAISSNITGSQIAFTPDDSKRDLLGFTQKVIQEEFNLSDYPVDILSFDVFLECDIAQGKIFKGRTNGIIQKFTMDVDPGYQYIEKFRGDVQWYMMENTHFISTINFELKNENGNLLSFNGQSITFRLSIKDV